MTGAAIAAQVHAGLVQAAKATGTGGSYLSLLRRRVDGVFEYHEITCVNTNKKQFDTTMMVQRTTRVLLVSATGEKPSKGDHVAVGFTLARLAEVENWARVGEVRPIEPAGVPLMYRLMLDE